MKTLNAKCGFILFLGMSGILSACLLVLGVAVDLSEGNVDGFIFIVIFVILLNLLAVLGGIYMYRQKSITYGNGRVTLKRVSKECVNGTGTPVGKWKNREDTFLLDELEAYGVSRQVLGYELEYDRARMRDRYNLEIFFQLKDGKKLAYEMSYHTHKQIKEFLNYIHEETGLELQISKPV